MTSAMPTIYLHGLPGGATELQLFGPLPATEPWHVLDRTVDGAGDRFGRLADRVAGLARRLSPAGTVRLVGFSLGAAAALRVAARLDQQVARIDLVSAAAPLELGNFLPDMAGRPVFTLARDYPALFAAHARMQGGLARLAPAVLARLLFASAQGGDCILRDDPAFRTGMINLLRTGHVAGEAYRAEISAYVAPWSRELERVTQPVRLFHGAQDNWTPPEMAQALALALPDCAPPQIVPGLSHYSALAEFLRRE